MAQKTQKELYDLFLQELQSNRPDLTDTNEGSIIDVLAGVCATAVSELNALTMEEFAKTYFDTANGPEVTGGPDDLQVLAVDHFGSEFSRPSATNATGIVTFSRPTAGSGDVVIPAGTIVKTPTNAAGKSQRSLVSSQVTLAGLTINASVEALVEGPDGNVLEGEVSEIESSLTDPSVTVSNGLAFSGGADQQSDSEYRETIRNKIEALRGSSLPTIEAKAATVAGVQNATGIESQLPVIEFDIASSAIKVGAKFFRIPYVTLYIADANGSANQTLIDAVKAAIEEVRAAGVRINVLGANAVLFNWTASITLNPSGPNYAILQANTQMIRDEMEHYIAQLDIGTGFDKASADVHMLGIYGVGGTGDLTAFATTVPAGSVAVTANQKLVPNVMGIA